MNVRIAYGKRGLTLDIPAANLVKVMEQAGAPPLRDPVGEIDRQLRKPIDSSPLTELARRAKSACIVISDITRPVPNTALLPPILAALKEGGIPIEKTEILIATGLHRPSTPEEKSALVGDSILHMYTVKDHHARVPEEQNYLGTTRRGTPVYIDASYCSADLKITTGFIEPHLMAGYSGGRKLVAPGCAGVETIKALHSPLFLEDPKCCEGSMEGNPLHDELLQIAELAGHDFIVNVSLDSARAITGVFAGHPVKAHHAGVHHVRNTVRCDLHRPVDIVVTTSAGYPLDLTYYQAVKGMTAALPIVREGGTLILAAECAEGLGGKEFSDMATHFASANEFIDAILHSPVVIDQWQLEESAKAARKVHVVLVADGIPETQSKKLFVDSASSLEAALQDALSRHGRDASVAVIPNGPYTLVGVAAE